MISDTILPNDIYLTQQNYQYDDNTPNEWSDSKQNYQHDDSNGNTPSDASNHESNDKNFDDEIQVSSYFINIVHSMVKIHMNPKMKMMINEKSKIV